MCLEWAEAPNSSSPPTITSQTSLTSKGREGVEAINLNTSPTKKSTNQLNGSLPNHKHNKPMKPDTSITLYKEYRSLDALDQYILVRIETNLHKPSYSLEWREGHRYGHSSRIATFVGFITRSKALNHISIILSLKSTLAQTKSAREQLITGLCSFVSTKESFKERIQEHERKKVQATKSDNYAS